MGVVNLRERMQAALEGVQEIAIDASMPSTREMKEVHKANAKVIEAFDQWQQAIMSCKEVQKHTKAMEDLAREQFRSVVEEPVAHDNLFVCKEHLLRTQSEWQSWCEMQAKAIEERKGAREMVTATAQRFLKVMDNVRQMELQFDA